jgi:hypothetical protein
MRFTKQNMQEHIANRMLQLEKQFNFDPQNGYNQVLKSDFERVIAYGEYKALDDLWSEIEYNNIGE